jgi:hypothetical protein
MQTRDVDLADQRIVRDYTSSHAFRKDAQELYARTGYTVMGTSGVPHRDLRRLLSFFRPRHDHLVITYAAPTTQRRSDHGSR